MQGNLQQNLESVTLCRNLLQSANRHQAGFDRCFISTSGAMANENAFKLLFHHQFPRTRILAFKGCFMGRSLTLAAVTDKPAYRKNLPVWPQVDYIPFFDMQDPEGSEARALEALKKHITNHPGEHAFMTMELILGEAGSYVGNKDFFKKIIEVLKANDIAIMVDEIQTFGRTHEMFAFQLFELNKEVDVVTVGKLSQVCATLFRESLKPPPGLISQTFTGSTQAIMAANVILEAIENEGFLGVTGKNNRVGNTFREFLRELAERYPDSIQGPYGLGAMVAFTAFQGDLEKNKAFIRRLFTNGVIAFLAGGNPSRIRFLPPIGVMEDSHIDDICTILEATLEDMLAS